MSTAAAETQVGLFLKDVVLAKRYGLLQVKWAEYPFRSKLMPNGYWITVAAIVIPSPDKYVTVFGASACAPDDCDVFDRNQAANRALGRARKIATRIVTQTFDAVQKEQPTLLGEAENAVVVTTGAPRIEKIRGTAEEYCAIASDHVERVALRTLMRRVRRAYSADPKGFRRLQEVIKEVLL